MNRTLLAFDLGAESGRAIRGDLQGDRLSIETIHRFANEMVRVGDSLRWNLPSLFEQIRIGMRLFFEHERCRPASIGIDTWGVDFGLLDSQGQIFGLPYAYRDDRTKGAMDSFFSKMPAREVYDRTGIQFLPFNSLFQIEAMIRDNAPELKQASSLLFMPDLFHYQLCGQTTTEFTFATTTQIFNPRKMDWDNRLIETLGVSRDLFGKVVMPGTTIGQVNLGGNETTGLEGTPIVAVASHDTGSAVAAVPAKDSNWAFISSGTWSLVGVESESPIVTDDAFRFNFTNEGGVGGTFRVLKNVMGLWLLQQCRKTWSDSTSMPYEQLVQSARDAKPFATLINPDDPSFLNPDDMVAAIRAFVASTGGQPPQTIGEIVRCILESLALKYRLAIEQVRRIHTRAVERIHVIGGGSQNRTLCQFTANATGLPVHAGPAEATAIGNILVQAMADGTVESLSQLRQIVARSFTPKIYEPTDTAMWDDAYSRFLQMMEIREKRDGR